MFTTKLDPVVQCFLKSSVFSKTLQLSIIIGFLLSILSEFLFENTSIRLHELLPPNFHLWTVVTYGFAERNPLCLTWSLICVHLATSLLEPVWGTNELVKFTALVHFSTALLLTVLTYLIIFLFRNFEAYFLFDAAFSGLVAFDAAVFVAVKQYLPDSVILGTPFGRIKNCHLPLMASCLSLLGCVLGIFAPTVPFMLLIGQSVAWIYLRYYQFHPNGIKGDMSDHFSWASFFPSPVQPLASAFSDRVYMFLLRAKICQPHIRQVDINQLQSIAVFPDIENHDAERRRQKALRDLTERLNRPKIDLGEWPNMEEESVLVQQMSPSPPLLDIAEHEQPEDDHQGGQEISTEISPRKDEEVVHRPEIKHQPISAVTDQI